MVEHEKKETLKFLIVQSEIFMFLFVYDFEKKIIIPLFTK